MYIFCSFVSALGTIFYHFTFFLWFSLEIFCFFLCRAALFFCYIFFILEIYIFYFSSESRNFLSSSPNFYSLSFFLCSHCGRQGFCYRVPWLLFSLFLYFICFFFSLAVRRTKYGFNSIIILFHHWMYAVYALWSLTLCLSHYALFVPFFGHSSSIAHAFCLHSIYNIHTMESWTLTPSPHSCDKFYFCALSLKTFAAQIYVRNAKIIRQVRHKRIMFSY